MANSKRLSPQRKNCSIFTSSRKIRLQTARGIDMYFDWCWIPELKSSFLYTRDLFFFSSAQLHMFRSIGGREKKAAQSYTTVPRLIAARGKTQFSSRARRVRADQIWFRRARRPRKKDHGRIAYLLGGGIRGRRSVSGILFVGKELFPRSRLGAFWHTAWKSANARNGPHTYLIHFRFLSRERPARKMRRNAGCPAARYAEKRAHTAFRSPPPPRFFFSRPSPVKPRRLFCLLRTLSDRV